MVETSPAAPRPLPKGATFIIERDEIVVPMIMKGKRAPEVTFRAVAVGLSENGFGFRSNDEGLGVSSVQAILRQAFYCRFEVGDLFEHDIICRILRLEACRYDPTYLYFGAAEFLMLEDMDSLAMQTGMKIYPKKKPARLVISHPPPPLDKPGA